jgi:biopolymer transport protein ExbD
MSFAEPRQPTRRSSVPLAPMLDILFLLLIFFVTTSTFRAEERLIDVNLPIAQTAAAMEPLKTEVLVNVRDDATLVVGGRTVSIDELRMILGELTRDFPNERVIIVGDKLVNYGRIVEVMDAARAAKVREIHFATVLPTD